MRVRREQLGAGLRGQGRGEGRIGPGLSWVDLAFRLLFGAHERRARGRARGVATSLLLGALVAVGTAAAGWIERGRQPRGLPDLAARVAEWAAQAASELDAAAGRLLAAASTPPTRRDVVLGAVVVLTLTWVLRWMDRGTRLFGAFLVRTAELGLPAALVVCALARPGAALTLVVAHVACELCYRRATPAPHLQHRR